MAMIVVLELFLLGMLGFLIQESVFKSASASPGDGSIYSWIPFLRVTVVLMIFGLIGGVMVKKLFIRERVEVTSITNRQKEE